MPKGLVNESSLNSIAEAINVLNGTEGTYTPSEMGEAIIDAIPTETASGNPINITDAANYPALSVVTALEPVQDLHGYDKPWPAGGGKNLLPLPAAEIKNGYTLTHNADGSVTVKGSGNATTYFDFFDGTFDSTQYAGYAFTSGLSASVTGVTFRISSSDRVLIQQTSTIMTISDNGNGLYFAIRIAGNTDLSSGVTIYPMLRASTETDDFAPYFNICPITGYTGVELTRTGKNLANIPDKTLSATGFVCNNTAIDLKPGTYTLSWKFVATSSERDVAVSFKDYNKSTISQTYYAPALGGKLTVTLPIDAKFISIYSAPSGTYSELQLEQGSIATTYEPYQGQTYSVTFPTEAGTVYGGTVDLVRGVLTVDKKYLPMTGTTSGRKLTNVGSAINVDNYYLIVSDGYTFGATSGRYMSDAEIISSGFMSTHMIAKSNLDEVDENLYRCGAYLGTSGTKLQPRIVFDKSLGIDTIEKANELLAEWYNNGTPFAFIYKLATPQTYQLTPQQIELLKGENNIWADNGDTSVTYKVDLATYIDELKNNTGVSSASLQSASVNSLNVGDANLTDVDTSESE